MEIYNDMQCVSLSNATFSDIVPEIEISYGKSIYTMEILANTTNQGLIYCFADCLDLKVIETILIVQIQLKSVLYL